MLLGLFRRRVDVAQRLVRRAGALFRPRMRWWRRRRRRMRGCFLPARVTLCGACMPSVALLLGQAAGFAFAFLGITGRRGWSEKSALVT